jgi:hypothetical protein
MDRDGRPCGPVSRPVTRTADRQLTGAGDRLNTVIPLTTLAWREVHHGHLPLWNPYSALGVPLAFNLNPIAFSVPALFGYMFPLRLDCAARLITTLLISGTGVYVFGRVLRVGVLGSVFRRNCPQGQWRVGTSCMPSCHRRRGRGVGFSPPQFPSSGVNTDPAGSPPSQSSSTARSTRVNPQVLLELLVSRVVSVVFLGPRARRPGGLRAALRSAVDPAARIDVAR